MSKSPKHHAPKDNPIPESVWDQIKSSSREPWREATMVVLSGHEKQQNHKHRRTIQANKKD